jgi:hypothetical protein
MADLGQDAPDLAVLPFPELDFEERRRGGGRAAAGASRGPQDLDRAHGRLSLGEPDPTLELLERLLANASANRDAVRLRDVVAGMREPFRELAVVGEDEEALGVLVEPTDREEPPGPPRREVDRAWPPLVVTRRTDDPARLIEQEIRKTGELHGNAIDLHSLAPDVDLRTKLCHGPPVDRDASFRDELLAVAARAHAGVSQELVKAFGHETALGRQQQPTFLRLLLHALLDEHLARLLLGEGRLAKGLRASPV